MHLQVRCAPKLSPPDAEKALRAIKDAGISLRGVGGSNIELGGEMAFAPNDDDGPALLDALAAYKPRLLNAEEPDSELTLCLVDDRPGGLHDCLADTAEANLSRGRVIRDILVLVPDSDQQRARQVPVQIYSEEIRTQANH
jgi:hypothetical protein